MQLLPKEKKLFFTNWLGLLAYINDKYTVVPNFGHPKIPKGISQDIIALLETKLWEQAEIIDEYIDSVWDMSMENIQILKGWKKKRAGQYIIVKHLKKYTVFLDSKNAVLYGVIGISNAISDMIDDRSLPTIVDTVLLPFGNRIIYDSLLKVHHISFGRNIRNDFKEEYMNIKKTKGIITTI